MGWGKGRTCGGGLEYSLKRVLGEIELDAREDAQGGGAGDFERNDEFAKECHDCVVGGGWASMGGGWVDEGSSSLCSCWEELCGSAVV